MGTSQAAKAASHNRILDVAAATIRRDGMDKLTVAELMKKAGLTNGGFYRHFDSREQLVAEATERAMTQGSAWTVESGQLGGRQGYKKLVNGYLSADHRDHPESGCGVAAMAADTGRIEGPARAAYSHQVEQVSPSSPISSRIAIPRWRSEKQLSSSVPWLVRSRLPEQSMMRRCRIRS